VLLEDIDAAFSNRDDPTNDHFNNSSNVTFSGLLNVLDGVAARYGDVSFVVFLCPYSIPFVFLLSSSLLFAVKKGWCL
jgi:hypothetical protein